MQAELQNIVPLEGGGARGGGGAGEEGSKKKKKNGVQTPGSRNFAKFTLASLAYKNRVGHTVGARLKYSKEFV